MSSPTRTYRGRAIDELIPRIQQELGSEAIIVRRREGLTGGILGFFQHPFVEIEAMAGSPRLDVYDEEDLPPPAGAPDVPPRQRMIAHEPLAPEQAPTRRDPPLQAPAPAAGGAPAMPAPRAPVPQVPPRFYEDALSDRAPAGSAYVTAHLARLARANPGDLPAQPPRRQAPASPPARVAPPSIDFQELIPRDIRAAPPERAPAHAKAPVQPRLPFPPIPERRTVGPGSSTRARVGVERSLRRLGISDELAQELIDGATAHTLPLAPRLGLAQAVRATLAQRIPVAPPLPARGAAIALVGAGGSGKTTCCATLLGAYRTGSTLPASYATLTHGGEGELSLLLSPEIMKPAPASSPRAVKALRRARKGGVTVLDTPRVSPSDKAGVKELGRVLDELEPERVIVALPATLGATAAAQLLSALRPLGADALAVTHADETDQIGVAVEAACSFSLAPEYILERGRSGAWRLSRTDPTGLAARLLP